MAASPYAYDYIRDAALDVIIETPDLYAWKTTDYYDPDDNTKPLTVYTLSADPAVGDALYDAHGNQLDKIEAWTGVEYGTCNTNTIASKTSTTITCGSKGSIVVK